ncbi:hypothetical protein NIES4071_70210 [Calothrix sp. NIES-4071]|nr:hypothetical protein NIES4071_70210 [Calothrix sp. NIES-4071]BAZ61296.1 hypothetical protein NIES4105_70160 [Calothrix sp. NIES-4105]
MREAPVIKATKKEYENVGYNKAALAFIEAHVHSAPSVWVEH